MHAMHHQWTLTSEHGSYNKGHTRRYRDRQSEADLRIASLNPVVRHIELVLRLVHPKALNTFDTLVDREITRMLDAYPEQVFGSPI